MPGKIKKNMRLAVLILENKNSREKALHETYREIS